MSKYHKTEGGLWPNDEKSKPSHPDMKGRVEVSKEQIKGLIAMHKEGKTPKIQLASWNRRAKDTGQEYQYVTAEVFYDPEAEDAKRKAAEEEAQAAPPPQPPPPEPQLIDMPEDDIPF